MVREFLTGSCSQQVRVGTPEAGSGIAPMCFVYLFLACPTKNNNVNFSFCKVRIPVLLELSFVLPITLLLQASVFSYGCLKNPLNYSSTKEYKPAYEIKYTYGFCMLAFFPA